VKIEMVQRRGYPRHSPLFISVLIQTPVKRDVDRIFITQLRHHSCTWCRNHDTRLPKYSLEFVLKRRSRNKLKKYISRILSWPYLFVYLKLKFRLPKFQQFGYIWHREWHEEWQESDMKKNIIVLVPALLLRLFFIPDFYPYDESLNRCIKV